ncbi:unnamed protein product [Gordionus sp. m RMFG-2023]
MPAEFENKKLRHVEKDILIFSTMLKHVKQVKCLDERKAFDQCCSNNNNLSVIYKCREASRLMQGCYNNWLTNPDFIKECTDIYLTEKDLYNDTGLNKQQRDVQTAIRKQIFGE